MLRFQVAGAILLSYLFAAAGCSQFVETKAIERFTAALHEQNLNSLRSNSSDAFNEKALRLAESLDDIKILRLPEEMPTVVKVEDESPTEKTVTVNSGAGRKLLYKLVRDTTSDDWVVDDIYMRQKKEGVRVTKSVTEQMDLLLTVREFLAAWQSSERDKVISVTTPEFGKLLEELPPRYLVDLTRGIAGDKPLSAKTRPQAQIDNKMAVVRLPRTTGELHISMRLLDDGWKVNDVAVNSNRKSGQTRSARKRSQIILSAVRFLEAYHASDRERLAELTTDKFYRVGLAHGDLASVGLPDPAAPIAGYEIRLHGEHATFIAPTESVTVKVDFVRSSDEDEPSSDDAFLVEEVTLYENDGSQQKRLSALFTSQARALVFAEALANRDLSALRRLSTAEFNKRVWDQVDSALLRELPIDVPIVSADAKIDTKFRSAVTEVSVSTGDETVSYILRHSNGEPRVDDIVHIQSSQPNSVRARMEVIIPVVRFAAGVNEDQVSRVQRVSSSDFNRLVWKQVKHVPDIGFPIVQHLGAPVQSIDARSGRATIRFGDDDWGAIAQLVNEHGDWVVDEINLIAGVEPRQRTEMKEVMRIQVGHRLARNRPSGSERPTVRRGSDDPIGARKGNSDVVSGASMGDGSGPDVDATGSIVAADNEQPASGAIRQVSGEQSVDARDSSRIVDPSLAPIDIPID